MTDLKVELREVREEFESKAAAPTALAKRRSRRRRVAWIAAVAVVLAMAAGVVLWRLRRAELPAPRLVQLAAARQAQRASFSPDRKQIAFQSTAEKGDNWDIWLKIFGEAESRRLTTDPGVSRPTPASHDRPRDRLLPRLVSGREGDRLRATASSVKHRQHLSGVARGRLGASPARPSCQGVSFLFPGLEGDDMWRVPADGGLTPERVELAGLNAYAPCTARSQDRLAFTRFVWDNVIYRVELGGSATPLIDSTARDVNAQYSPDGRQIAFASRRSSDRNEVWLADAEGTNPTRLTRGPGRFQGSPRWSPDGRTIAFDSRSDEGPWDIWTIGVDGLGLRQVTHDPSMAHLPSFSRDGRWIYFGSDRTGREEVWRVAAAGGPEEQVTHEGGGDPFESLDGRTLYYLRSGGDALLARPTAGGAERTIVRCVNVTSYAVGPGGIYYVACNAAEVIRQQIPVGNIVV